MPKRTSPKQINDFDDLNDIDKIVFDKRNGQRSKAKKGRRNRHYTKLLIKHEVNRLDSDEG
jgi:hypothetical protein